MGLAGFFLIMVCILLEKLKFINFNVSQLLIYMKMKNKTIILFFALMIMMPEVSYGQLGKMLKNAASKAVSTVNKVTGKESGNPVDTSAQKKANLMINDAPGNQNVNNQPERPEGQGNQGMGGLNLGKLLGGNVDLKYSEEYKFTSRLHQQTETYDKKDVSKMDFYTYFSSTSPSACIESKSLKDDKGNEAPVSALIILDAENKCVLMLSDMNGQKMGLISPIQDETTDQTQESDKPAEKVTPPTVTKTGNTKVIAGYKCDEYTYKDPDSKGMGKVWFSKDVVLNVDKRGWAKAGMPAYYGFAGFKEGVILSWESYDENGKLSARSETKEINNNFNHSISTAGYILRQTKMNMMNQQK
jgi:hypothetical protein